VGWRVKITVDFSTARLGDFSKGAEVHFEIGRDWNLTEFYCTDIMYLFCAPAWDFVL
jgi:hypothetical protein